MASNNGIDTRVTSLANDLVRLKDEVANAIQDAPDTSTETFKEWLANKQTVIEQLERQLQAACKESRDKGNNSSGDAPAGPSNQAQQRVGVTKKGVPCKSCLKGSCHRRHQKYTKRRGNS